MASWARQRQQITEAADGGARARTGADGAVALNLRRGPGAYALLSRAASPAFARCPRARTCAPSGRPSAPPGPGSARSSASWTPGAPPLSGARQAREQRELPARQWLIGSSTPLHLRCLGRSASMRGALLRNGQKKLVRSLQGGERRLTKLGKGFFRDKYYEYLVHVPVIIRQAAQRAERGRGLRAQGLAAGERAGRRHDEAPGAPHGGAGGAAGQATSGGLAGQEHAPRTAFVLKSCDFQSGAGGPGRNRTRDRGFAKAGANFQTHFPSDKFVRRHSESVSTRTISAEGRVRAEVVKSPQFLNLDHVEGRA